MRILAFDTATPATAVALSGDGERIFEARDEPAPKARPGHVSRLLPLIADVLDQAQLDYSDLDRIAVGVGPGTFTGLRIGIATARGLARSASLPLVGVSTLHSLALAAAGTAGEERTGAVAAVIDARRGEVFLAAWARGDVDDPGAPPLIRPRAVGPEATADTLRELGLRTLAVGDGAVEYRGILERSGAQVPEDGSELHRVTAAAHLRIGERLPASRPEEIQPVYLRLPDAREPSSAFASASP